jgi:hypothetical protein
VGGQGIGVARSTMAATSTATVGSGGLVSVGRQQHQSEQSHGASCGASCGESCGADGPGDTVPVIVFDAAGTAWW